MYLHILRCIYKYTCLCNFKDKQCLYKVAYCVARTLQRVITPSSLVILLRALKTLVYPLLSATGSLPWKNGRYKEVPLQYGIHILPAIPQLYFRITLFWVLSGKLVSLPSI